MKCREFDDLLAEWIRGRLPEATAARMHRHRETCAVCARAEAAERALQERWRSMERNTACGDLWPRLAARLEPAPAAPRLFLTRSWAFGGAVAGFALLWAIAGLYHPTVTTIMEPPRVQMAAGDPPSVQMAGGVDERHVIHLISDIQRLPEDEAITRGDQAFRPDERALLIGSGER